MEQVGTVLLWWTSSVGGSIFSKKVFEAIDDFSIPLTFAQITTAAVCMSAYYTFNGYKRGSDVPYRILGILTMLHMFGNLFTNVSMEHGNVAFTHTVKASEPLFTILFSQFFSNTKESQHSVYLATLPLIIGVVITTVSEVEFSLIGLFTALCSNVCFALRNVWVKQTTSNADNFQLFFHFSLGSSILLGVLQSLRSTFLYPWIQAHPQVISEDQSPVTLFWWIILASVLHFLYNIFSFAILQEVTPLTHAVINLVKRTAIIFGSMLVFSTPTSILNLAGIFITLAGGALFSAVKIKIHSNHHHPKNAGEIPIHVQDHSKSDEPLPSNRKSLFVFIGLIFTAILLFSLVTTQSNTTSNSDIIETAVHIPTNNQESTTGMPNSGNPQSNPPAPTNETNQVVPTTEECSLTDTLYEKLLNKTDSLMMRIGIESVPNSVVLVFGFTAIQGSQQHFGQFGASYVIDREMRARFGEDVMVLPFPPSTSMQKLKAATPFSDMVVMNFEGSFHDNSWGSKYIIEGLNYFINYSVPTYAINIAWYPTTEKEQGAALIKNPIVKHVAARDQKSFQSMKELGIDVHQAADLTFLLPYKFDCLVNQFFAEKNRFWAQSEKLKIVVTKDSGGGGTTQKVVSLIRKEYGDNVEIISILDYVFQGNRLVHITEDSIYEALWIIKNADLVITGRFHCATFARLVSVPTAMLSGNTPKLRQLSAFINSTAYPYIHAPDQGMTYTETIWKKAKEALEYSKTVNLEDDGLVPILRELASVNFPEGSYLYNRTQVTIDELRRELNFSQVVKGIWGVVNTTPANYYALQYNTTKGSYTSYDYPLKL